MNFKKVISLSVVILGISTLTSCGSENTKEIKKEEFISHYENCIKGRPSKIFNEVHAILASSIGEETYSYTDDTPIYFSENTKEYIAYDYGTVGYSESSALDKFLSSLVLGLHELEEHYYFDGLNLSYSISGNITTAGVKRYESYVSKFDNYGFLISNLEKYHIENENVTVDSYSYSNYEVDNQYVTRQEFESAYTTLINNRGTSTYTSFNVTGSLFDEGKRESLYKQEDNIEKNDYFYYYSKINAPIGFITLEALKDYLDSIINTYLGLTIIYGHSDSGYVIFFNGSISNKEYFFTGSYFIKFNNLGLADYYYEYRTLNSSKTIFDLTFDGYKNITQADFINKYKGYIENRRNVSSLPTKAVITGEIVHYVPQSGYVTYKYDEYQIPIQISEDSNYCFITVCDSKFKVYVCYNDSDYFNNSLNNVNNRYKSFTFDNNNSYLLFKRYHPDSNVLQYQFKYDIDNIGYFHKETFYYHESPEADSLFFSGELTISYIV